METYPAKVRTWRDFLTLIKNEGRDDVVVLLDRAVGARREGREDGFWKRQEREAAAKAAKEEKVVEA